MAEIPTYHTTESQIVPEAERPTVATLDEARIRARTNINQLSFNIYHPGGHVITGGREVSPVTLGAALDRLMAELSSGDSDPVLTKYVISLANHSTGDGLLLENPLDDPLLGFLYSRGGYVERKRMSHDLGSRSAEESDADTERGARFGHQILADGHILRGTIVPGIGVRTDQGILRTRGNPRVV